MMATASSSLLLVSFSSHNFYNLAKIAKEHEITSTEEQCNALEKLFDGMPC